LKTPEEISRERIVATYREMLEPFMRTLQKLIEKNKYAPNLIYQLDETSCLIKSQRKTPRVVPATVQHVPIVALPVVHFLTALFIITADGRHMPSHALLPETCNPLVIQTFHSPFLILHQTPNGWMTKTKFRHIVEDYIVPDVEGKRAKLSSGTPNMALIIMDGATAHPNFELILTLKTKKIDVCVIPSHTSHRIQPLDLCVNAQFNSW
jgi:hypothetical protein